MIDTTRALADMARQIRECRSGDRLTLQQLATRSGVAASTIHKVEAGQMVPTVSVLLKIAKGLGRRPDELIRDPVDSGRDIASAVDGNPASDGGRPSGTGLGAVSGERPAPVRTERNVGVWHIDVSEDKTLPTLDLDPQQRAIVLVERGEFELRAGEDRYLMDAGDCIEIEGGRIEATADRLGRASLTVIVSPRGNVARRLGEPEPNKIRAENALFP